MFKKGTIQISVSEGIFCFEPAEIVRLEASSNYTFIHFAHRRPLLIAKVLKGFEGELLQAGFIRPHRKHMVNTAYINRLDASGSIVVNHHTEIKVARRKKDAIKQSLAALAY
jgi:two-component system, LytTR family, response regulator